MSFNELNELGFTPAQITSIAGHSSGYKNIDAVKMMFSQLRELGFTVAQITSIAGRGGGYENISINCRKKFSFQ